MPTPCNVTGNLQYLSAGQIVQGHATFELTNLGSGNIPRVLGTAIFPANHVDIFSDNAGLLSGTLWGNDVIDPANTVYSVTFYDNFGNHIGPVLFSVVGPSFNLNNATPTNTLLPPVLTTTGFASGLPVASGNFVITGWGTGATVTNVLGFQGRCSITITAGTGPTVSPTVQFTFPTVYPNAPLSIGKMTDGTGSFSDIRSTTTTTVATYTYSGVPVATKTYVLIFDTQGI